VTDVSRETDAAIDAVFGACRPAAERYVAFLADQGLVRGLIGPREVPRLWERHVLNCAVVAELLPPDSTVRDVGSGAGLPGIPLALARPDLEVELVEPLLRRAVFLTEAVELLGLDRVRVTRSRAEDLAAAPVVDVATARAVAGLPQLARWCLPLVRPGGSLVALKGARVHEELDAATRELRTLGARTWQVTQHGGDLLAEPTTAVTIVRGVASEQSQRSSARPKQGRGRR